MLSLGFIKFSQIKYCVKNCVRKNLDIVLNRPAATLYDGWGQNFTSAPSHPVDPKNYNDQSKR